MKCGICGHGNTQPGVTTVTLERGSATVVFKNVPAEICANCGERYVSEEVTNRLLRETRDAAGAGVEVEVRLFAA